MATPVAVAYRNLIRVAKNAFKGDEVMIAGAMIEIKTRFMVNHEVKDKEVIAKKLEEAKEAAGFIKDFVVQSKLDENGHFGIKVEKRHVDSMQDFVLEHVDPSCMKVPKKKCS